MVRTLLLSREESSPIRASVRGGTGGPFTLFSLVGALYLIVALSVPGAFLVAKQASLVSSGQHQSLERFGSNAGAEDGGEDSWPGPKRLRGALLHFNKAGIDKNFLSSLLPASYVLGTTSPTLEPTEREPVVAEEALSLKDSALPQELLGRSPPLSLSYRGWKPPHHWWIQAPEAANCLISRCVIGL